MNEKDISVLLNKADELRSLFVLGQRVIPFLEEIFVFVRDIQPMFDEINHSINDNLKKMPGASEKLSKVTEANELATTEIMDTLDKVFEKTSNLENNNHKIKANYEKIAKKPIRLLEIIHKGIEQGSDLSDILPQLAQAINKLKGFSTKEIEHLEKENDEIIQSMNNDASAIMMSLQVQDITSQQLAAVDHMLHAVQQKLSDILMKFKKTDITKLAEGVEEDESATNVTHFHRDIAFDPNAISSIENQENRQNEIDDIISKRDAGEEFDDRNEEASQDDIDEMFNDNDDLNVSESEVLEEAASDDETLDPDDIDAMFGAANNNSDVSEEELVSDESNEDLNEEMNPDDIDAMFGATNNEVEETSIEDTEEDLDTPVDPDDIDAMFDAANNEAEETIIEAAEEDLDTPVDPDDIDAMFAQNNVSEESESLEEDSGPDLSAIDDEDLNEPIDPDDIDAMFSK